MPGASAFVINVDPLSAGRGTRIPLWTDFRTAADAYRDPNLLTLMPVPGHVLDQGTLYAAVLTDDMRDTLAAPLTTPPVMQRLEAETPAGAFETAALPLYQTLEACSDGSGCSPPNRRSRLPKKLNAASSSATLNSGHSIELKKSSA